MICQYVGVEEKQYKVKSIANYCSQGGLSYTRPFEFNSFDLTSYVGGGVCIPRAVLAGVASLLIQKETQERTTVRMQGM